jgi:hypothetical protein
VPDFFSCFFSRIIPASHSGTLHSFNHAGIFNQSLIVPDQIFNRDQDRAEKISIDPKTLLEIFQAGSG